MKQGFSTVQYLLNFQYFVKIWKKITNSTSSSYQYQRNLINYRFHQQSIFINQITNPTLQFDCFEKTKSTFQVYSVRFRIKVPEGTSKSHRHPVPKSCASENFQRSQNKNTTLFESKFFSIQKEASQRKIQGLLTTTKHAHSKGGKKRGELKSSTSEAARTSRGNPAASSEGDP